MNIKKSVATAVAGVMLGGMAAVGCSSQPTEYDRVYDTHTHSYVVVTHDYYTHHQSLYSGPVVRHVHAPAKPKSTKTAKPKASKTPVHKKVVKHVKKVLKKRSRR